MTILNIFGCEAGDLSEIASTSGTVAASTTKKRSGTYSLRHNPANAASLANHGQFAANGTHTALSHTTLYINFGFMLDSLPTVRQVLWAIYTAVDRGGTELLSIDVNTAAGSGAMRAGTGSGMTNLGVNVAVGTQYFCELRWTSGSQAAVRVTGNGGDSGWVTVNGGTGTGAYFTSGHSSSINATYDMYTDDVVISDAALVSGGRVLICLPMGAGASADWTNGSGTTFAVVDEVPHNSDSDYLMETGTNGTHILAMQDSATIGIAAPEVPQAVKIMATVRNVSVGAGSIALRSTSGATSANETAWTTGGTTYVTLARVKSLDNTGADWTTTLLDGLQVGVVNAATNDARCTAIYAMVLYAIPVSLAGAQPAATGSLAGQFLKVLAGAQDAPSGTVAANTGTVEVTITGSQPAATGALASLKTSLAAVAGSQGAPSGALAFRRLLSHFTLAGAQAAASGALAVRWLLRHITLAGAQPAATGDVAALELVFVSVGGTQPQPTGSLSVRFLLMHVSVAGAQGSPSGGLVVAWVLVHVAGEQPGASGEVTALIFAAPLENVGFAPLAGSGRLDERIFGGRGQLGSLGVGRGRLDGAPPGGGGRGRFSP